MSYMNKETLRENLPAIIAIGLPVALVLCIALLTALPSFGPKPKYDFLFLKEPSRSFYQDNECIVYQQYYEVKDQKLIMKLYTVSVFDKREVAEPCYGFSNTIEKEAPQIYVYSTEQDTFQPIDFETAKNIPIRGQIQSPDGFGVSKRIIQRGIFDLFGNNSGGVYLTKNNRYTRISIDDISPSSYYDKNFSLIGWIDPYTQGGDMIRIGK